MIKSYSFLQLIIINYHYSFTDAYGYPHDGVIDNALPGQTQYPLYTILQDLFPR